MRSDAAAPHVAVVGAGFSGTMVGLHLAAAGVRVTIIDRSGRFGEGLAYGTREHIHLLNVRASGMSAFADAPDHFTAWLAARGEGDAATFAPRETYRAYLHEIMSSARIERLHDEVLRIADGVLHLASGARLQADAIVVAAGNLPPAGLGMLAAAAVPTIADPWSEDGRAGLRALAGQAGDVLIVGTGLTMVDTVLTLASHGFGGRIEALSRRGLLPRAHAAIAPRAVSPPVSRTPIELLAWVRRQAGAGEWRAVVDSLRPATVAIWRGWSVAQRSSALRHLRPWWDVHRHRVAPAVATQIGALTKAGRLSVRAGRIVRVAGAVVTIRGRGAGEHQELTVGGIVDCTGPRGDIRRSADPLITALIASGKARTDAFGLGLDTDEDGRVLRSDGAAGGGLYAVGPMTRGTLWEIVAVPDIRVQAARIARTIADDLRTGAWQATAAVG